ncbi:MAG: hypothetical protein HY216_13540 [Candidatus Rokubacteria bacterium]|nr:hypothetical protein [Candidatus Rokubacteria bacterium]
MMVLFVLMLAGYAGGTAAAVLFPDGGAARRWTAAGAVVGSGAGLALAVVPCGIYGAGYSGAYERRCSVRLIGAMLNLFLLTMSLVPCAANVLTFLLVRGA